MSWLTGETIEQAVDRCAETDTVRQAFIGVYPHNSLPTTTPPPPHHHHHHRPLPLTLVINTDTHNLPGRHWISIYIDKQRQQGEIFDSLATPPSAHVVRFMGQHCRKWVMNRLIYQHPLSSYCGVYVLLHVLHRHRYNSLETFCSTYFSSSLTDNDRLMRDYYRHFLFPRM